MKLGPSKGRTTFQIALSIVALFIPTAFIEAHRGAPEDDVGRVRMR
jgi:hypothetical protein